MCIQKYRKYFRGFLNLCLLNFGTNSWKLMHREYYHFYSTWFVSGYDQDRYFPYMVCKQTYGKCWFGSNFGATRDYKMSYDLASGGLIFVNLIRKDAQGFKEKSHRKECCDMAVGTWQKKISYKCCEIDPSPLIFYENIFVNVNNTWLGIYCICW